MDVVIRNINLKCKDKVKFGPNEIKNTIAYADDLAIVVKNMEDLKITFQEYEKISKMSGLYLNAEKTEILRLDAMAPKEIDINIYQNQYRG